MKNLMISAAAFAAAFFAATETGVDWAPSFNDAPVKPEDAKRIEEAVPAHAFARPAKSRKMLVYSATSGFRHKSIPHGKMALEIIGKRTGAYEAVISDELTNFEPDNLKKFDAVCLLNVTGDFFLPHPKDLGTMEADRQQKLKENDLRLKKALIEYVESGGGLVGIHSATDACYQYEQYGDMVGGYFDGHPWTQDCRVTIRVEDPEHELTQPVFKERSYSFPEEIYQFKEKPYSRERLRVLLNLDPEKSDKPKKEGSIKRTDNDFAVCWVQKFGRGRVFYTSLGHREDIYMNPVMLGHYLAGIQFALGDLKADTTPSAKLKRP
ncbi:MAG TPA: ThuA domain-containing protein [Verrucomicrobiae bacterium]|nr:ThuA domain-containing protein [Verrucomicrobiae bacterium]